MLVTLAFNVLCTTQRATKLVELYLLCECYHISFPIQVYLQSVMNSSGTVSEVFFVEMEPSCGCLAEFF